MNTDILNNNLEQQSLTELELNPRYIASGFKTQAINIKQTCSKSECKIACLLEVIASHILKHDADCFASTKRMTDLYNQFAPRYSLKEIKERTLYNLLNQLEKAQIINRDTKRISHTWQNKRHITINLEALKTMFRGVFNWAFKAATAFINRKNLHSRRCNVENELKPNNNNNLNKHKKSTNCTVITNDLSKESNNKYNGIPSDDFYQKHFGCLAKDVQSLQDSARKGTITPSGARKLIGIHAKFGYELAKGFKRFLNYVIAKEHNQNKALTTAEVETYGGTPEQAKQAANAELIRYWSDSVDKGLGEFVTDRNGRVSYSQKLQDCNSRNLSPSAAFKKKMANFDFDFD